jgi:hypothetical protein
MTMDNSGTVVLIGDPVLRAIARDVIVGMGYCVFEADDITDLPVDPPTSTVLLSLLVEEPATSISQAIRSMRLLGYQVPIVVMAPQVGWELRQRALVNGAVDTVNLTAPVREVQDRLRAALAAPNP